jgi:hypothetical protein
VRGREREVRASGGDSYSPSYSPDALNRSGDRFFDTAHSTSAATSTADTLLSEATTSSPPHPSLTRRTNFYQHQQQLKELQQVKEPLQSSQSEEKSAETKSGGGLSLGGIGGGKILRELKKSAHGASSLGGGNDKSSLLLPPTKKGFFSGSVMPMFESKHKQSETGTSGSASERGSGAREERNKSPSHSPRGSTYMPHSPRGGREGKEEVTGQDALEPTTQHLAPKGRDLKSPREVENLRNATKSPREKSPFRLSIDLTSRRDRSEREKERDGQRSPRHSTREHAEEEAGSGRSKRMSGLAKNLKVCGGGSS